MTRHLQMKQILGQKGPNSIRNQKKKENDERLSKEEDTSLSFSDCEIYRCDSPPLRRKCKVKNETYYLKNPSINNPSDIVKINEKLRSKKWEIQRLLILARKLHLNATNNHDCYLGSLPMEILKIIYQTATEVIIHRKDSKEKNLHLGPLTSMDKSRILQYQYSDDGTDED